MPEPDALVAGVDEVGRGPLAGPVVAGAVVLDPQRMIEGLDDSKKLAPRRREALAAAIERDALAACVALATVEEIDRINILQATMLAMQRAIAGLPLPVRHVHVDGNRAPVPGPAPPASALMLCCGRWPGQVPNTRPQWTATCIVGGDGSDAAIGAASILAKVHRDRLMAGLDGEHPGYGFARHKGYGTKVHLQALRSLGPCPAHRHSFAPVRDAVVQPPAKG